MLIDKLFRASESDISYVLFSCSYLYLYLTFGEDNMLSSAEAVISFGPMRSPEITERLCKSLQGFCKPQKSVVELVEVQ